MSDDSKPIKGDSDWRTGDTPPDGNYVCSQCGGMTVAVPEMYRKLPKCKNCQGTLWYKV